MGENHKETFRVDLDQSVFAFAENLTCSSLFSSEVMYSRKKDRGLLCHTEH
jgi:hypothetical protein